MYRSSYELDELTLSVDDAEQIGFVWNTDISLTNIVLDSVVLRDEQDYPLYSQAIPEYLVYVNGNQVSLGFLPFQVTMKGEEEDLLGKLLPHIHNLGGEVPALIANIICRMESAIGKYLNSSGQNELRIRYKNVSDTGFITKRPVVEYMRFGFESAPPTTGERALPVLRPVDGAFCRITGYPGVTGSLSRSFEAWIKTLGNNQVIVSWGVDQPGENWLVKIDGQGRLRVSVNSGYIVGSRIVNDGEWHHIAVVFDPSKGTNVEDSTLYVDAVLQTISASNSQEIDTSSNGEVWIGDTPGDEPVNQPFDGEMVELRIWNIALTQYQVDNALLRRLVGNELGLAAYWPFYELSGPMIFDHSGNNRHGRIEGSCSRVLSDLALAPGAVS